MSGAWMTKSVFHTYTQLLTHIYFATFVKHSLDTEYGVSSMKPLFFLSYMFKEMWLNELYRCTTEKKCFLKPLPVQAPVAYACNPSAGGS